MRIETLSLFPELFEPWASTSILGRARQKGLLDFVAHDLRNWTHDKHRTVDDEPYGGGPGQLMKAEPVFEALDELLNEPPALPPTGSQAQPQQCSSRTLTLFFAPHGLPFNQRMAQQLAGEQRLIMVCGRYEGFDERVYTRADLCLSLGDYILTGGELAACVVTDAVCRLLPGVLGHEESNMDESFGKSGLLEYPQYTRPASYRGLSVPEVLLSGNHAAIAQWRRKMSIIRTMQLRPDLLAASGLSEAEIRKALETS